MTTQTKVLSRVTFSGEESDRFVRFAQKLVDYSQVPYVIVRGREPLTRTEITIEGRVQSTTFDRYIRYITISDRDGQTYNIGGSNATESIAASEVTYTRVPPEIGGIALSKSEIEQYLNQLRMDSTNKAHLLIQLKANVAVMDQTLTGVLVDTVLRYTLNDPDVDVRREAVDLIAGIDSIQALSHLLELLEDPSPQVRRDVALRLRGLERRIRDSGSHTLEKCMTALIDRLLDEDPFVRTYAVEDLGYIWEANYAVAAVKPLIDRLQNDQDDHVRWAAAIALGRINASSVIDPLFDAAMNDQFFRVRQSALLGLGRRAKEAFVQHPRIVDSLVRVLEEDRPTVKGYAAFALGQFGETAKQTIDLLLNAILPHIELDSELKYVEHIRSNAVLALGLLSDWIEPSSFATIEHNFQLALRHKSQYTEKSPYFTWFLMYAAELLSSLEIHSLAQLYYSELSDRYVDWRRMYYRAASMYELGEYLWTQQDSEKAHEVLLQARQTLLDCKGYPADAETGFAFHLGMVNARINIIEAIEEWEEVVAGNFERPKRKFETAQKIYGSFRVRESDDGSQPITQSLKSDKRLTRREQDFIYGLRSIAHYGTAVIEAEEAIRNHSNIPKAIALLATLQNDVEILLERFADSRTRYLLALASRINDILLNLNDDVQKSTGPSRQVHAILKAVREVRSAFKQFAIPMPATSCPIVGLGKAEVDFRVTGILAGTGQQYEPYLFPCDVRLIIEADVRVIERTRMDDELIFIFHNKDRVIERIVPVYDQGWQIPIDLGVDAPAFAAFPYDVSLEFRGKECSQVVCQRRLWIQRYDPDRESLFPTVREHELQEQALASVKVAVAQILMSETRSDGVHYLHEFYMTEYLQQGLLVFKKNMYPTARAKFQSTLQTLKDRHPDTALVLFPELSAPWAIRNDIVDWSAEFKLYIIVGFEHRQDPVTHYWQNQVQVFSPRRDTWTQSKNYPAEITLSGERIIENIHPRRPRIFTRMHTALGKLMVLICSEAISGATFELGLGLQQHGRPDILVIPSMSPVVHDFYGWADAYLRKLYCGILFANHAQFGFSTIFSPKKEELKQLQMARSILTSASKTEWPNRIQAENHGQILGPMEEGFVTQEIEIDKISQIREGKSHASDYISPPT